ncbi:hypothetical protein SAY86_025203 [Trapa natans]|uniref:DYW domain-containing protein n=1 Tax=Trapa natans TaxID=22666 RepID=A0AAN7MWJ6_TRANT|nr:hypothetical protein SAY86_025203 [Trapa natans]
MQVPPFFSGIPPLPPRSPPAGVPSSTLLTAASHPSHLKLAHAQILRCSNLAHTSTTPLLLRLILSSPSLDYALSVFRHVPDPGKTPLFNKFLSELSRGDDPGLALKVFDEVLRREGVWLDRFSFPPALKAAAKVRGYGEGMEIHGLAAKFGFDSNPFVQTGLVGMYTACGRIMDAHLVFDRMSHRDIVAWNTMIDGCCRSGFFDEAVKFFEEMKNSNVEPDKMLLSTVLCACAHSRNLIHGKAIHEYIAENNIIPDPHLQSALICMYASTGCMDLAQELFNQLSPKNLIISTAMISWYSRCGQIENARAIFDQIGEKDLVCWSAMISAYAESDRPQESLVMFEEMQKLGLKPDQVTILSVISACAQLGSMDRAKQIHVYASRNGFGNSLPVNNALIDMYAKCGNLKEAISVFERISNKNMISWTSMITACAMHGDALAALRLFNQMKEENIEPNEITFIGVLYACSHAGLVKEGREIFDSMINEHMIIPRQEHYGCMVDLLGRANLLREALKVIVTMPIKPNVVIWGSLMSACQVHGAMELGELAAKQVLKLEPNHNGAHVLLSNIYAREKRWQDVGELRNLMRERGIWKEKGCSRIEMNGVVHEFLIGDRNHDCSDQIYMKLDAVVEELKQVGYSPSCNSVHVDLEDEEKREVVLWHSEKLALCYGLLNENMGSSCVRIIKNLRVCEDCHTFMKLASKVYKKEIIIRDRTRFHHCRDGICSCKDYW